MGKQQRGLWPEDRSSLSRLGRDGKNTVEEAGSVRQMADVAPDLTAQFEVYTLANSCHPGYWPCRICECLSKLTTPWFGYLSGSIPFVLDERGPCHVSCLSFVTLPSSHEAVCV